MFKQRVIFITCFLSIVFTLLLLNNMSSACTSDLQCLGLIDPMNDPCVISFCNFTTNLCQHDPMPGVSCNDEIFCNGTDTCDNEGICSINSGDPCPDGMVCEEDWDICRCNDDAACDDNNPCTEDTCEDGWYCLHYGYPRGSPCDDGLFCNGEDMCDLTHCVHSGSPCPPETLCSETTDTCDDATMCKGNFDFDQDVDGSDAFTFKEDFGRNILRNPCPPDGPAPVEKTWQTTSYETGDDGDYQSGVPYPLPRFTDNEDGTVTDNLTGLIWLKDANCFGARNWSDALSDCNGLADGSCGLTDYSNAGDWRLANITELLSLIHWKYHTPAIPDTSGNGQWSMGNPFVNIQSHHYWTSTTHPTLTQRARCVNLTEGNITGLDKVDSKYFWPVRAGH